MGGVVALGDRQQRSVTMLAKSSLILRYSRDAGTLNIGIIIVLIALIDSVGIVYVDVMPPVTIGVVGICNIIDERLALNRPQAADSIGGHKCTTGRLFDNDRERSCRR